MFYVFVFDKIRVRGEKLMCEHIKVSNVLVNVTEDQSRVFEEGPFAWSKDCQDSPKLQRQKTAPGIVDAPSMGIAGWHLGVGEVQKGPVSVPNHRLIERSIFLETVRWWPSVCEVVSCVRKFLVNRLSQSMYKRFITSLFDILNTFISIYICSNVNICVISSIFLGEYIKLLLCLMCVQS